VTPAPPLVLALDQGTSSTRCLAVGPGLEVLGSAQVPVAVSHPGPGRVEQDAEEILASAVAAIRGALAGSGRGWEEVGCLSIATQTETFVVWDRASGRALHPAVGWQDHRSGEACEALRAAGHEALVRERTGLPLDPTFPPTKLRSVLDGLGAEPGGIAYGDVASWLAFRLSGGAVHISDVGNASRSSLVAMGSLDWDLELLALFGVPAEILPQVVASDAEVGRTAAEVLGGEVPIAGLAGDQQASLFGHGAWSAGEAKVTLGTGAFLWANAGSAPPSPGPGIVAGCAWSFGGEPTYALEGLVPAAGTVVDWLVRLGLLDSAADLDRALGAAADTGAVAVPALAGLGTPSWRTDATGSLAGLTAATGRDEIVAAMVDGILHQVADAAEAMAATMPLSALRVDGGLARSPRLLQRLSDLTALPVERSAHPETTAIGTALIGALAAGAAERDEALRASLRPDLLVEPSLADAERDARRERWREARDATIARADA
jgi:glycerol kinase